MQALARQLGWPRQVALTEHDNQLVFDLERDADVILFLHTLKGKERVTVREFPFAKGQVPVVSDQRGEPYVHQFLAALYHEQEVYPGEDLCLGELQKEAGKRRKLLPGGEWLYFKIHCHPSRSNELLSHVLLPAINQLRRKGEVRQWFYVRYRDPGYHLRVRLSIAPERAGHVTQFISSRLSRLVEKGEIGDFQLAIYERELERYGSRLIQAAEDVFCASSDLLAASIRKQGLDETDYRYYGEAFTGLQDIAGAFKLGPGDRVTFFHQLYEAFYREFKGDKALREQLSLKYRGLSKNTDLLSYDHSTGYQEPGLRKLRKRYRASLQAIAGKIGAAPKARQLMADLMHMHLNRLFVDQARQQELVVYYCLWKLSAAALAQSGR